MIPEFESIAVKGIEYTISDKTEGGMGEILFLERSAAVHPSNSFVFSFPKYMVAKNCKVKDESGFIRECNIWLDLGRTEGVAPLLHVIRHGERVYAVMPKYEGNLSNLLNSNLFERRTLIRYLIPCFDALYRIAKTMNIIHRDIKPENILYSLVDGEPQFSISDWGIAQLNTNTGNLRDRLKNNEYLDLFATWNTEPYCSPERFTDPLRNPDTREDIFSFGIILMEILCSERPYKWASIKHEIIHGAYFSEAKEILSSNNIQRSVGSLILAMLHPDIEQRPNDFRKISKKVEKLF